MKKTIFTVLVFLLLAVPCYGAAGDIAGQIYSTDILTYVNGKPIEGYNIGGKTAVVIEDMGTGYGISYNYNDEERLLLVEAQWYKNYSLAQKPEIKRDKPGRIVGSIYETDIRVILNGSEVKGYNLGGRTAIVIEDIGTIYPNPNEGFGYSKYLCNFEWNDEDRTVSLNFVDGYKIEMGTNPLALSSASVKITAKDEVLIPEYDPLNDFFTKVYSSEKSEKFLSEPYVLKTMYFEIDGEKYDIGLCYATEKGYVERFIKNPGHADGLLKTLAGEPVPCEEALRLLDDGEKFVMLDRIETEDFYFVVVQNMAVEGDLNNIMYIAVKKTGGYAKINGSSSYYTERELEKTGINTIYVTVAPFAGPHGATKMGMEFNLNNYIFW